MEPLIFTTINSKFNKFFFLNRFYWYYFIILIHPIAVYEANRQHGMDAKVFDQLKKDIDKLSI